MLQIAERTARTLCVAVFVCSCTCWGVPRGFFQQLPAQRYAEFESYDFETQYKIYICGQQCREPPDMGLAIPFARQGGRIVQPLKSKLQSTDNDQIISEIIFVFGVMSASGTYDVAGDKALMSELREKTSAIRDPAWRKMAEKDLQFIVEKSPKT